MDFRILKQGGETNISNNDIQFMQYSNYFGISAIGAGLDINNSGLTIVGCQLQGSHNPTDDTITASITDGYVVINGIQTKCESTPSVQFVNQYYNGYRKTAYIFAEVVSTFNPLGDKVYVDSSQQQTWQENRIALSYSFTATPVAGTILIGSCYVGGLMNTPPSPIVVTQLTPTIGGAVVRETGNADIINTSRAGRPFESVSVSNLFQVLGNQSIVRITSTSYSIQGNGQYVYFFECPADTLDAMLLGASYTHSPTEEYGSITGDYGYSWGYNRTTKILSCYFDLVAGEFATALIAITRVY